MSVTKLFKNSEWLKRRKKILERENSPNKSKRKNIGCTPLGHLPKHSRAKKDNVKGWGINEFGMFEKEEKSKGRDTI